MSLARYVPVYFRELGGLFEAIEVRSGGRSIGVVEGYERAVELVRPLAGAGNKVMLVGNGASAAIASHQAADFLKASGVPACAFNDAPLMSCLGNDLGYEHTFDFPVGMMARRGDLLICISSSGASPNILNAARKGREVGCGVMTLSGFAAGNPLRALGDLDFYVPSHSYGQVEVVHLAILHCVNDFLAGR